MSQSTSDLKSYYQFLAYNKPNDLILAKLVNEFIAELLGAGTNAQQTWAVFEMPCLEVTSRRPPRVDVACYIGTNTALRHGNSFALLMLVFERGATLPTCVRATTLT